MFFTIGLALWLGGERVQPVQVAALALGAAGLVVIAAHGGGAHDARRHRPRPRRGARRGRAATSSSGAAPAVDMLAYVVWASLFAVPPLFALSLLREGWPAMVAGVRGAGAGTWAAVVWQAVGNTMFGYGAWGFLLGRYPAATVAPWSLLVPVFGMGTAALVLGEPLPAWKLGAGVLVMAGSRSTCCGRGWRDCG